MGCSGPLAVSALDFLAAMETGLEASAWPGAQASPAPLPLPLPSIPPAPRHLFLGSLRGVGGAGQTLGKPAGPAVKPHSPGMDGVWFGVLSLSHLHGVVG